MPIPTTTGDPTVQPGPVQRAGNGLPSSTYWAATFDPMVNWLAWLSRSVAKCADGASMTIDISARAWVLATPTAARNVSIRKVTSPAPVGGEFIFVKRPATGNFAYSIITEGGGVAVVLPALTSTGALLYYEPVSGFWRLLLPGAGAVPGDHAD